MAYAGSPGKPITYVTSPTAGAYATRGATGFPSTRVASTTMPSMTFGSPTSVRSPTTIGSYGAAVPASPIRTLGAVMSPMPVTYAASPSMLPSPGYQSRPLDESRIKRAQREAPVYQAAGSSHGPWSDPTFCEQSADIHAPNYFSSYADFGSDINNFPGELGLKMFLTEEMYNSMKDKKTTLGVTLDKCIKGGVDTAQLGSDWNTGKVGFLLGDAECIDTFKELVHPLMVWRHGNPQLPHPRPNLDGSQLLDHTIIDQKYVKSTRVRTGRSISGFALPPSISADQRKELEGIVVSALATLSGELKGDYYPLAGSNTYAPKPGGITKEVEEQLIKNNFLFQEPDEPMLLSWRMERDWPNARGIYHNEEKTALVWVNEEDHIRIISMQKDYNIRAVFDRFANLVKAVEGACVKVGRKLEISDMYGNVLSCPSNCGTGLRASMMIMIPLTTQQPNFKQWCADRKLQARGSGGFASQAKDDGVRDVSNVDRMGKDEVTLVNEMIQGVADLIAWEKELEAATGKWNDPTFCARPSEIHAPKYFNSYADFGNDINNFPGELGLKIFLTEDMYNNMKDRRTTLGVTLDKCIKGGVDTAKLGADWNTGKVGFLLGDAECIDTFKELVHPLMVWRHGNPQLPHPRPNLDGSQLLDHTIIDQKYVKSTRVRTGRSISGFALPPSISRDQRRELEGIVVSALATLSGELKGDYYPLAGSTTYAPKPGGITKEVEEQLIKNNFLFQEPDEPMLLSWRMERDWPHARGIYHNEEKTALVWVNEEDHIRIISMQKDYNIRAVFDRFANLVKAVEGACVKVGRKLEISDMYGNVLSCPSNCGTGLRASMMIMIPLTTQQPNFKQWCADRKLQARGSGGFASQAKDDGVRDVSNVDRMGKDEVTLVNEMIQGVADLIAWEKELEAATGKWNDPTFCARPSEIHAPKYFNSYADFGNDINNFPGELGLKMYLTEEMYNNMKDRRTALGVTLDKCIKGGVDTAKLGADWNTGKVGFLLGDAECIDTFKELVHPLMVWRHGNPQLPHPRPNLDGSQLLDHTIIDQKYVKSTRVRTGRSISGFALPPSISRDQRRELEGIVVSALATLSGELKGDYYPLAGSTTYAPKPGGITKEVEEQLIKNNFLFQEPDEPMLLSWRMERDWPHARGIYHNEEKTALVWVNEEDHIRIISMQKDYNIRAVFDRFANLVKAVEGACVKVGRKLEISDMYGNVLSCPSNCGTGLRASMMIMIPLTTQQPNFKQWCADRKLQARGSGGFASQAKDDGVRDVSNVDRMGKDEVTLVNEMIQGVADLIAWEKELEAKA